MKSMTRKLICLFAGAALGQSVATFAQQKPADDAGPAPEVDDMRTARKDVGEMRPMLIHHIPPVAGDGATLVRHVFKAEFLPECGPQDGTFRAVSTLAGCRGRHTPILPGTALVLTLAAC